jgi:hypothetical protein
MNPLKSGFLAAGVGITVVALAFLAMILRSTSSTAALGILFIPNARQRSDADCFNTFNATTVEEKSERRLTFPKTQHELDFLLVKMENSQSASVCRSASLPVVNPEKLANGRRHDQEVNGQGLWIHQYGWIKRPVFSLEGIARRQL